MYYVSDKLSQSSPIKELERRLAELENGSHAFVVPSGTSAIAISLMAYARPGSNLLITDNVYTRTRTFCERILRKMGATITYFNPEIGSEIEKLICPETTIIFCESPGSWTFEIQDIQAISRVAHQNNIVVAVDNSWATPLYCNPIKLGADIVIHSLSKYIAGYSDVTLGAIVVNDACVSSIKESLDAFGVDEWSSDEPCYLALRGINTLPLRLLRSQETALGLIKWLVNRSEISEILHPSLPNHCGHEYWIRDFSGSAGLFSFVLHSFDQRKVNSFLDSFKLFDSSFGWGGYKSLIRKADHKVIRTQKKLPEEGGLFRISIGIENLNDLISDFDQALKKLR